MKQNADKPKRAQAQDEERKGVQEERVRAAEKDTRAIIERYRDTFDELAK